MGATESKGRAVTEVPNVKTVHAEEGRRLAITWKGGSESIVDVSDHLAEYAVFAPLRDNDERFCHVEVGDWGWCVHWSDDMEISADTLWRLTLEQGAEWLRRWRTARRMTQAEAARALGVSSRMWRYYEAGSHLLPKTVKLAGIGLDALTKAA
jgi:hypothetical protein